MKRQWVAAILIVVICACSAAHAAPPIFKDKKYFGPMPFGSLSLSVGFLDGADFSLLTDALNDWAVARHGSDNFGDLPLAPSARLSYEYQLTPNHFLRVSSTFTYLKQTSTGSYIAAYPDTNYALDIARTLKVYLLTFEAGFSYYFITPAPESFSPYAGAGFGAVIPMVRLDTKSSLAENGAPFANPGENVSSNTFEAGLHVEFGMNYYLSNRFALGMEGKYQMAQSKFDIHGGNFDLKYTGVILSLNLVYYL